MEEEARLFSALADPTRLEILRFLSKKKGCVSSIQSALKKSQPNISQHLRVLREARLIWYKKEGKQTCYFICKPQIAKLIQLAKRIAKGGDYDV
ncbi:MAG: metalloregulator ArsR/SmtB family transcription factor [Candidatus Micrarchaeota archaeon]|nr:metalloregulator ArsR/SmtB family transcription factor [Candidatus Micrarchaeota archaeon]